MDPKALFKRSLDQASACVAHVEERHFGNATPCEAWTVKDLLNHMVYELLWIPDLLAGKTIQEVGNAYEGDVLGNEAQAAWDKAAKAARQAVKAVDLDKTVHLSYADKPAAEYIYEVGGDIFIHTWDLDQGMQCSLLWDPDVTQVVYDNLLPRKQELAGSGLFGTPKDAPADASVQEKLLALTGRSGVQ